MRGKSAVDSQQSIVKGVRRAVVGVRVGAQQARFAGHDTNSRTSALKALHSRGLVTVKPLQDALNSKRLLHKPLQWACLSVSQSALATGGASRLFPAKPALRPISAPSVSLWLIRIFISHKLLTFNLYLLTLLFLTACGVVAVQVEEPIPTPTLADTPIPPPPINAESSAGLVAYEAPDDSDVMVKTVALPRIVYSPGGLAIEMFEQWAAPTEYLVVDKGQGFRLRVNWSTLWLTDAYGTGRITMDVYLLSPNELNFQFAQNASTPDIEGWGADQRHELLDSTVYLPGTGEYRIRADVSVEVRDDKEHQDARSYSYESQVIALNSSPKLLSTPEDFTPQFGDLENQGVLLDWRGWRFGPCFLRADDLPDVAALISEACVGFASNDWGTARESLLNALDGTDDNPALHSRIVQQLGTLAAVSGDWQKARECFEEGLRAARAQNDALEVAIALHNLGISQRMTDSVDEGEQNLWQSIQLSDQIEDWLGAALTYGQFGYYWQDTGTLEWVTSTLRDNGIPQAAITQSWLDGLYAQQGEGEGG